MKLYTKLVIIILSLLIIAVTTLFALNQYSQADLVDEIVASSTEISKAIQLSIADLTSESETDPSHFEEYMKRAQKKGVKEVNVINIEGEIITSTNPSKVGEKRDVGKLQTQTGLRSAPRPKEMKRISHNYDLLVPVIVGDQQLGYVQINLLLDNIKEIQHTNFIQRLIATSLVFILGIALAVIFARRYTAPIHRLVTEVREVATGDLSVTFPAVRRDEIGELAANLNEMVVQLRERKILEQRLAETEHLSRVGQLASGIAHEIRNPLNYISLAVDHLIAELGEDDGGETKHILEKIKDEIRAANYMLHNFMSFGRPLRIRPVEFSFLDLVQRTLPRFSEKIVEGGTTLTFTHGENIPPMCADQELIRTCIINLLTNAIQAVSHGGKIEIDCAYDHCDLFTITVADDGHGVAPEHAAKIFQPYFTTKEAGIGLGLAMTQRIIEAHGGRITADSVIGQGTTFTINMPRGPYERHDVETIKERSEV